MPNEEHLKILKQGVEVWNKWMEENPNMFPDLRNADLSGGSLSGTNLNANLTKANLSGADLSNADLRSANLTETNLTKTNLTRANLTKANLVQQDFSGTDLSEANLSGAFLGEAVLNKAKLNSADLNGAYLYMADLSKTDLRWANLAGADLRAWLREADLREVTLTGADMRDADLFRANLSGADLRGTDLRGADLREADLSGVNLSKANLSGANLSGAIVDEEIKFYKIRGIQKGVNGIYSEETDSAALMTLVPRGNSMQGSSPDVVVESLKRARRLHGYSLTVAGFAVLIAVFKLPTLEFPNIRGFEVTPDKFILLAMPITIAILIIVNSFFQSALNGARYLQDRDSAMKVGNFPWSLSRYSGESLLIKSLSYITRFAMIFHPIVYIYFLGKWGALQLNVYMFLMVILLILSVWTFSISQGFQKPILFDTRTERERKTEMEKLTIAVQQQTKILEGQTAKIGKLIDLIKPKKDEKATKQTKRK